MALTTIPIQPSDLVILEPLIGQDRSHQFLAMADGVSAALSGRLLISVSSTAKDGGVAEMLHWLLRYVRGAGIDINGHVINGRPDFFAYDAYPQHAAREFWGWPSVDRF